ncbi:hypothetical protein CCO03_18765 [Comamonas serinivorans]|uniref:Uncharacterized protein n=1 Tax=Comamonas serinivorans TaxID=1082851 RepID=A0A1Y0ESZ8_9BURK|nr:hypothetical protein [Comamonas serinivorans]ARU06429.1 hypothetical protein CCO03_18765 [Comamonas serinivorans]
MTQPTPTGDAEPTPFHVRVVSDVQHRIGDGALETIAAGQDLEVTEAIASMVLSWKEDGQGQTAILAKNEFQHYLETGALQVL